MVIVSLRDRPAKKPANVRNYFRNTKSFQLSYEKSKALQRGYCKADTFIQGQRLLECKCGSEVGLGEMVNLSVVKILIGSAANVICALIA